MAGVNFKEFEPGQDVEIFKGKDKGNLGTVIEFDSTTGRVDIELANGTMINAANGVVRWQRNEFYDGDQFDLENEMETPVEPVLSEYARDPEVIVEEAAAPKPVVKKKESKPCQCHCGEICNPGRMFRPGHDQRHKGNLIEAMQAGSVEAEEELLKRRWRNEYEILALKAKAKKQLNLAELEAMEAELTA